MVNTAAAGLACIYFALCQCKCINSWDILRLRALTGRDEHKHLCSSPRTFSRKCTYCLCAPVLCLPPSLPPSRFCWHELARSLALSRSLFSILCCSLSLSPPPPCFIFPALTCQILFVLMPEKEDRCSALLAVGVSHIQIRTRTHKHTHNGMHTYMCTNPHTRTHTTFTDTLLHTRMHTHTNTYKP